MDLFLWEYLGVRADYSGSNASCYCSVCDIGEQIKSNAYRSCNDPHSPIQTNKNLHRSAPQI
jgi:hypothetical protein